MLKRAVLIVNFGGPRTLDEVPSFLKALLTDEELIRTPLPSFLHKALFSRIAKKRALKVSRDYEVIGGGSPIFADTEWVAKEVERRLSLPVLTFHRYLTKTHESFLSSFRALSPEETIVFPLFPQFSYATTGSVAKWLSLHLTPKELSSLRFIKSYARHPAYLQAFASLLREHLRTHRMKEEESLFLFSAHGLPLSFIEKGDPYQRECEDTFYGLRREFPLANSLLAYQSKFGKGEWLSPSTEELCGQMPGLLKEKKGVIFVPLSFSSDHIETLFEIEKLYVEPLLQRGVVASRCPALGRREEWIGAIARIIQEGDLTPAQMLVYR